MKSFFVAERKEYQFERGSELMTTCVRRWYWTITQERIRLYWIWASGWD